MDYTIYSAVVSLLTFVFSMHAIYAGNLWLGIPMLVVTCACFTVFIIKGNSEATNS